MKFTPLMNLLDYAKRTRNTDYVGLLRRFLSEGIMSLDELDTVMEGLPSRHAEALLIRVKAAANHESRFLNCTEVGATLSPPIGRRYTQQITSMAAGDAYVRLCYLAEIYCGEVNIEWTKLP